MIGWKLVDLEQRMREGQLPLQLLLHCPPISFWCTLESESKVYREPGRSISPRWAEHAFGTLALWNCSIFGCRAILHYVRSVLSLCDAHQVLTNPYLNLKLHQCPHCLECERAGKSQKGLFWDWRRLRRQPPEMKVTIRETLLSSTCLVTCLHGTELNQLIA